MWSLFFQSIHELQLYASKDAFNMKKINKDVIQVIIEFVEKKRRWRLLTWKGWKNHHKWKITNTITQNAVDVECLRHCKTLQTISSSVTSNLFFRYLFFFFYILFVVVQQFFFFFFLCRFVMWKYSDKWNMKWTFLYSEKFVSIIQILFFFFFFALATQCGETYFLFK